MTALREYIVNILTVSLLAAVFDILLPEGNIKKYANAIIGLSVAAVIVMPIAGVLSGDIKVPWQEISSIEYEEEYMTVLEEEFCDRTEKLIEEKSGGRVRAEVIATVSEDTRIEKVTLYGNPDSATMFYITDELGVNRNVVEIRK